MATRRILITRPEPGASATTKAVRTLGLEPVLLPLTQIVSLPQARTIDADAFDAVAATSANALRHAAKTTLQPLLQLPCHAVGAATAASATGVGFSTVTPRCASAAGLASAIVGELPNSARIAYLCGRVRLPVFEAELSGAGLRVTPIETYDTQSTDYSDAELSRILTTPVDCALVHSALAADALGVLVERPGLAERFANTDFFCISARVASRLDARIAERVQIAARPDDDALLAMLASEI